jgi:hypothetical protein
LQLLGVMALCIVSRGILACVVWFAATHQLGAAARWLSDNGATIPPTLLLLGVATRATIFAHSLVLVRREQRGCRSRPFTLVADARDLELRVARRRPRRIAWSEARLLEATPFTGAASTTARLRFALYGRRSALRWQASPREATAQVGVIAART